MGSFYHNLRFRFLCLGLLAVVPAMGLSAYHASRARQSAMADWEHRSWTMAQVAAAEEEEWVETTHQLLSTLAQVNAVRSGDILGCRDLFDQLLRCNPRYANWVLASPDGKVLIAARPGAGMMRGRRRLFPRGPPHPRIIRRGLASRSDYGFAHAQFRLPGPE